ncbi:MAG: GNAT family N-acetyltransferase [Rhodospirillaceae bacterium]|nr:GNAT family N-acetyltransferase [Rhodospirillaceae bacterium]MBT6136808.1 GNAT family N-acetyltransferase [Rhodospirillaceae bacterium]
MSRQDIDFRSASVTDAAAIARVQVDTWRDAYVGILPDQCLIDMSDIGAAARWTTAIAENNDPEMFVVAVWNGEVVGFCQGAISEFDVSGPPGAKVDGAGVIHTLYVDPSFQAQGIGTAMMFCVADRLREVGCRSLMLLVLSENRTGRGFYDKLGGVAGEEIPCVVLGNPTHETPYHWPNIATLLDELEAAIS